MSKSLMKKLKIHEKKFPKIFAWKNSINNHLWWSAQTCKGDSDILIEKFISILHHIKNEHKWMENGIWKFCEHDVLSKEDEKKKSWINGFSSEYKILEKIILDKTFLKDLAHIKHYIHSGSLESYHSLRLKYAPKRIHLSYNGIYLRSIIEILDHNSNVNKEKIGVKTQYSKTLCILGAQE